jgi:hypothetical protein
MVGDELFGVGFKSREDRDKFLQLIFSCKTKSTIHGVSTPSKSVEGKTVVKDSPSRFIETIRSSTLAPTQRRERIVDEIIETEKSYCRSLNILVRVG